MTRKEAREETFILIFEKIFNPDEPQELLNLAAEVRDIKPDAYIQSVFLGVCEKQDELDAQISTHAVGWAIGRISKTSLAILRLAIYEMQFVADIPVAVSINEAVELCKKYALPDDAAFVNGLLGTVARELTLC